MSGRYFVSCCQASVALAGLLALAACGQTRPATYVAFANPEILVLVEGVQAATDGGGDKTAVIHYYFSRPRSEEGREYMGLHSTVRFDCPKGLELTEKSTAVSPTGEADMEVSF